MVQRRDNTGYDPFEPGHSTPEFEQYARENYAAHARQRGVQGSARVQSPRPRQVRPSASADYEQSRRPASSASVGKGRAFVSMVLVVLLAMCIEVFGFNLAFFTSWLYPDEGSYLVNGSDPATVGELTLDASSNSFEITGLDATIDSIHFAPTILNEDVLEVADDTIQVVMYLQDEGNANYYALPAVTVDPDRPTSTYIGLEPAGNCHSIRVTFTNLATIGAITVDDISLNAHVPFSLDPVRVACLLVVLSSLAALQPKSRAYALIVDMRSSKVKAFVVGLVVFEIVAVFFLALQNTHFVNMTMTPETESYYQYQILAEALAQGHLYLNDVPSDALLAMDNPYDTAERAADGVPFLWDHAYFEGRYYVYFGVLPCLVFFLPYYLLTGTHFATWLAVAICAAVYVAGLAYLLAQICKRWFPRTSIGAFVILDVMLCIGGSALILVRTPSMYFLPEAMGLACVAWGLALWIRGTSQGYIDTPRVVAGAFLFALTLAARPQMVLGAVFGLLLFWPFLRVSKGNRQLRRQALRAFRAALVPFVVVGVAVLAYNAARFGSPFDFGANYNLTTNDMTHRGFHVDRIPFGLFAYLFQPPSVSSQFPFMNQTYLDPAYQGITIYEPMFGGYFFLYPMTLVLLALPKARRGLQEKGLFVPLLTALGVAFVLVNFDLQGAGILMRYICDFGIYIALAASIVFLELLQVRSSRPLTEGWTTDLYGGSAMVAPSNPASSGMTVSVYRISLYFAFASLVVMVAVAVLLWDAFGMY